MDDRSSERRRCEMADLSVLHRDQYPAFSTISTGDVLPGGAGNRFCGYSPFLVTKIKKKTLQLYCRCWDSAIRTFTCRCTSGHPCVFRAWQQAVEAQRVMRPSRLTHFLDQRWPTGGPRLDLLRPPPSHRFGSIGGSFNLCLILLVQRKI
jgi:hypothetical protein